MAPPDQQSDGRLLAWSACQDNERESEAQLLDTAAAPVPALIFQSRLFTPTTSVHTHSSEDPQGDDEPDAVAFPTSAPPATTGSARTPDHDRRFVSSPSVTFTSPCWARNVRTRETADLLRSFVRQAPNGSKLTLEADALQEDSLSPSLNAEPHEYNEPSSASKEHLATLNEIQSTRSSSIQRRASTSSILSLPEGLIGTSEYAFRLIRHYEAPSKARVRQMKSASVLRPESARPCSAGPKNSNSGPTSKDSTPARSTWKSFKATTKSVFTTFGRRSHKSVIDGADGSQRRSAAVLEI